MTFGQIKQAVQMAFSSLAIGEIKKVCKFIGACNDELALHSAERHPVILIVDHVSDCRLILLSGFALNDIKTSLTYFFKYWVLFKRG